MVLDLNHEAGVNAGELLGIGVSEEGLPIVELGAISGGPSRTLPHSAIEGLRHLDWTENRSATIVVKVILLKD